MIEFGVVIFTFLAYTPFEDTFTLHLKVSNINPDFSIAEIC